MRITHKIINSKLRIITEGIIRDGENWLRKWRSTNNIFFLKHNEKHKEYSFIDFETVLF